MPKAEKETVGYEVEMSFEYAIPPHRDSEAHKMKMIASNQLAYAKDLFWLISTFSGFATSSLLIPETEINEFEFDHIHTFEVFQNIAELGKTLIQNANYSIAQIAWIADGGNKIPIYKGFHDVEFYQSVEKFIGDYNRLSPNGQKKVFEAFNGFQEKFKKAEVQNG